MLNAEVIDKIINYQEFFKDLLNPLKEMKEKALENSDSIFEEDIENQFQDLCRQTICKVIAKDLACDYESVIIVVESLNIEEYIK